MRHYNCLINIAAFLIILLFLDSEVNADPRPCDLWNMLRYPRPKAAVSPASQPMMQQQNLPTAPPQSAPSKPEQDVEKLVRNYANLLNYFFKIF